MAGLDSLLATSLARRLDTLLDALNSVSGTGSRSASNSAASSIGEAASSQVALTTNTRTSTGVGADIGQGQPLNPPPQTQPPANLSTAARTIDTLLQLAPDTPGAVVGDTPLWPLPPGETAHAFAPVFAAALKNAIDSSGLFYESHLAQWAAGSLSLEQLQQNPQAGWSSDSLLPAIQADISPGLPAGLLANTASPQSAGGQPAPAMLPAPAANTAGNNYSNNAANPATFYQALPAQAAAAQTPNAGLLPALPGVANAGSASGAAPGQPISTPGALAITGPGAAAAASAAPAPQNITLVRQQLEMLVAPQFHWTGEVWPGAPLDWTVEERRDPAHADEPAASGTWQTRLRLSLAALGTVDVGLSLAGHQLQVQVRAAAPDTVSRLTAGSDDLRQRLAGTGLMAGPVRVSLLDDTARATEATSAPEAAS